MNLFARIRASGAGAGQSRGFSQDQFVKTSASDSTGGYLIDKLTAGHNISIVQTTSANKALVVRNTELDYLNGSINTAGNTGDTYLPLFRGTGSEESNVPRLKPSFFNQGWSNANIKGFTSNIITRIQPSDYQHNPTSEYNSSPNDGSQDQQHLMIFRSLPAQGGCGFAFQRVSGVNSLIVMGADADAFIVKNTGDVDFYHKVTINLLKTGVVGNKNLNYVDNQINADYDNPLDVGAIVLNKTGYLGGITKFRSVEIYNGRNSKIVTVEGSTGNVLLNNKIQIGSSGPIYQEKSLTGIVGDVGSTTVLSHGLLVSNNILSITAVIRPSSTDSVFPGDADTSRLFSVRGQEFNVIIVLGASASIIANKDIEVVVRYK